MLIKTTMKFLTQSHHEIYHVGIFIISLFLFRFNISLHESPVPLTLPEKVLGPTTSTLPVSLVRQLADVPGDDDYSWLRDRSNQIHRQALTSVMMSSSSSSSTHRSSDEAPEIDELHFDRISKKFFVPKERVQEILSLIVEHLPVYTFNESEDASVISQVESVYFDDRNFSSSSPQIRKGDSSASFRLRWYNQHSDQLFMERKMRKWGERSSKVKERFPLLRREVAPYLAGKSNPLHLPKDKTSALSHEIQNAIVGGGMKPVVRTISQRIAFQHRHSNEVRITLDKDVVFQKEGPATVDWRKSPSSSADPISTDNTVSSAYAILETKLRGASAANPPLWLQQLLKDPSMVQSADGFSKFRFGVFQLYQNKFPWLDKPVLDDVDFSP